MVGGTQPRETPRDDERVGAEEYNTSMETGTPASRLIHPLETTEKSFFRM